MFSKSIVIGFTIIFLFLALNCEISSFISAEKSWPADFDTSSSTSIVSDINENILVVTSLPTSNQNLVIRNSMIAQIFLNYSSSSSPNRTTLLVLTGSSSIIIQDNTIGAITFTASNATTGILQMNDASSVIIRNNTFLPDQYSSSFSSSPTFLRNEPPISIDLRLNSSLVQIVVTNNTFYSHHFNRSYCINLKIPSTPFTSVTNESQHTVIPTQFGSISITNNKIFTWMSLSSSPISLRFDYGPFILTNTTAIVPSSSNVLLLSKFVNYGSLINVSGNIVLVEKTENVYPGPSSLSSAIRVYFTPRATSLQNTYYTYQITNVEMNNNNITVLSTLAIKSELLVLNAAAVQTIVPEGGVWRFNNNYIWKNFTDIAGRDEILLAGNSTDIYNSDMNGLRVSLCVVNNFVSATTRTGKFEIMDNIVFGAANEFSGVDLAVGNSAQIDGIFVRRNYVHSNLMLRGAGIRIITTVTLVNVNAVEFLNNTVIFFNLKAAAANASSFGNILNFQLLWFAQTAAIEFRAYDASQASQFYQYLDMVRFENNQILSNGKLDTIAINLASRWFDIKNILIRNNSGSVYSYPVPPSNPMSSGDDYTASPPSSSTKEELFGDVSAKQSAGIKIATQFINVALLEVSGNSFFVLANVSGITAGVVVSSGISMANTQVLQISNNNFTVRKYGFDPVEVSASGISYSCRFPSGGLGLFDFFNNILDVVAYDNCPPAGCTAIDLVNSNGGLHDDTWSLLKFRAVNNTASSVGYGTFGSNFVAFSTIGYSSGINAVTLAYVLAPANYSIQMITVENNSFTGFAADSFTFVAISLSGNFRSSLITLRGNVIKGTKHAAAASGILAMLCPYGKLARRGYQIDIKCEGESIVTLANSFAAPAAFTTPTSLVPIPGLIVENNIGWNISTGVGIRLSLASEQILMRNNSLFLGNFDDITLPVSSYRAQPIKAALLAMVLTWQKITGEIVMENNLIKSLHYVYCDDQVSLDGVADLAGKANLNFDFAGIFSAPTMFVNAPVVAQTTFSLVIRNVTADFNCRVPSRYFPSSSTSSSKTGVSLVSLKYPPRQLIVENINAHITVETNPSSSPSPSSYSLAPFPVPISLFSFFGLTSSTTNTPKIPTQLNISSSQISTPVAANPLLPPSSTSSFSSVQAFIRNPTSFYTSSQMTGQNPSSSSVVALIDCVEWNAIPVTMRLELVKTSPFDIGRSLVGCNGKYGISRSQSASSAQTKSGPGETGTQHSTDSRSVSPQLLVSVGGLSTVTLQRLYGASTGATVVAAVIGGSPATLLSGSNGIALVQLARCALEYEANGGDAFGSESARMNYSRTVLSQPVNFPRSFLPNLKIGGSEYRGAVVGHLIAFVLVIIVTLYIGFTFKSIWKQRVLKNGAWTGDVNKNNNNNNKNSSNSSTTIDFINRMSIGLFAPWDYVLLRGCIFVVSLGGDVAGALINAIPASPGDIVLGVLVHGFVGFAVLIMAIYFWSNQKHWPSSSKAKGKPTKQLSPEEMPPRYFTEASEIYFSRVRKINYNNNNNNNNNNNKKNNKNNPNQRLSAIISFARRCLQTKFSRFCLIGDIIWYNKYSSLDEAKTFAGPGLPTQFTFTFRKTIGPQRLDLASASTSKSHKNNNNNNEARNNHKHDGESSSRDRSGNYTKSSRKNYSFDNSLRLRLAPYYLYVGCVATMVIMLNSGAGSVAPHHCKTHFIVACVASLVSSIFLCFTRPYNVPFRNLISILIDLCLTIGIIILASVVFASSSGGAGKEANIYDVLSAAAARTKALSAAQLLCSLGPTILGSIVSVFSGARFVLVYVSKGMVVTRTSVRIHLPKDLDSLQEEMLAPFLLSSKQQQRTISSPSSSSFSSSNAKNNASTSSFHLSKDSFLRKAKDNRSRGNIDKVEHKKLGRKRSGTFSSSRSNNRFNSSSNDDDDHHHHHHSQLLFSTGRSDSRFADPLVVPVLRRKTSNSMIVKRSSENFDSNQNNHEL